eukprot:6215112-Prorocentrum_lima.AAC.1
MRMQGRRSLHVCEITGRVLDETGGNAGGPGGKWPSHRCLKNYLFCRQSECFALDCSGHVWGP